MMMIVLFDIVAVAAALSTALAVPFAAVEVAAAEQHLQAEVR